MIPPILMYHRIGHRPGDKNTVSPERFELQLQYLEDHKFTTFTLSDWYQKVHNGVKIPEKSVILTFDDGYRDNWELAMPLLLRYGCTATVFMISSLVGKTNLWEKKELRQGVKMMEAEHLREWTRGGMEVGSHGVAHCRVTTFNEEELKKETLHSKQILEEITGEKVNFFCYPNGSFNEIVVKVLQEMGYWGSVAIYENASWNEPVKWFALPRIRVTNSDEPGIFRWKVSKYHSWIGKSRKWEKRIRTAFRNS